MTPSFHTSTALAQGLHDLLAKLAEKIHIDKPLTVYLAGGLAVHLYTGARVTTDVDAEYSARIYIPADITTEVVFEDGEKRVLYFDTNYNSTFALMHEDYQQDSIPVDIGIGNIQVRVLSPADLAVSKISRLAEVDREDIIDLARHGLITADAVEKRALAALTGYVGGVNMLRLNIKEVVELVRREQPNDSPRHR